jgi:hypothetical protein
MSIKEIEELRTELANLKEKNRELFQKTAKAVINERIQEFLNAFEDYFRERGFVIRKKDDSIRASYETLHFKAFTNDRHDIFIMKGKEQIASITVNFKSSIKSGDFTEPPNNLEESIVQIEREIEKEKISSNHFENPVFYCSGSDFGLPYDNPLSILESIFNG